MKLGSNRSKSDVKPKVKTQFHCFHYHSGVFCIHHLGDAEPAQVVGSCQRPRWVLHMQQHPVVLHLATSGFKQRMRSYSGAEIVVWYLRVKTHKWDAKIILSQLACSCSCKHSQCRHVWDPCASHDVVILWRDHYIKLSSEPSTPPCGWLRVPSKDGPRSEHKFMPSAVGCDNIYDMCTHPADLIWLQKLRVL